MLDLGDSVLESVVDYAAHLIPLSVLTVATCMHSNRNADFCGPHSALTYPATINGMT